MEQSRWVLRPSPHLPTRHFGRLKRVGKPVLLLPVVTAPLMGFKGVAFYCLLLSRACAERPSLFPAAERPNCCPCGASPGIERLITGRLTVMSCFYYLFRRNRNSQEASIHSDAGHTSQIVKRYSYKELKHATDDFSLANKIGEGGFGSVYKGRLRDGTVVAIKVLSSESQQGVREFLSELETIANIVHRNLVKLCGCCVEGNNRILVYDYVANNSLARTLLGGRRSNIQFNWGARTKICIGVARGLAFLHEEVHPRIVHRDIKASNILLDEDLTPKISDFGLARLLPSNATHVSTRVAGTIGYLAPEYAVSGRVSRKADIYSFGVLLLEIVSGQCNTNARLPHEDRCLGMSDIHGVLAMYAWELYQRNELISIVDPALSSEFDPEEACKFLKVGLLCAQDNPKLRPSMSNVVKMLTGEMYVNMERITKPGVNSDFMDFKIRSQRKAKEIISTEALRSDLLTQDSSLLSSNNTTHASLNFTNICDRDD
ncbi:hypothetical protein Taro_009553 [Colocasia esculenta]|uniref:Protein kinase domain-containing protein n=1 Tax=Colocasia esculenta TaxID=4460 RepID=A0A843U584_COLES|nr:hypothetical protein [Colocasia esculenta]